MKHYEALFSEGRIGKLRVKNRIVMPPMASNLANADGSVSERMIEYYKARAMGGVGMIIIENVQVDYPRGKDVSNQLRIDDLKYAAGLFDLTEAVHDYGAKIILQLQHSGRQTGLPVTENTEIWAPSPIPDVGSDVQPKEMTIPEIRQMVQKFVDGARFAKIAKCDGVEVHGAHGYLINEFMSPRTNKRMDLYGGSFEKRMRFPLEIIKGIKEVCGEDYPISFRLSADEFIGENGNTLADGKKIAKVLEDAGVHVIHVSSGIYESITTLLEPQGYQEGWRLYLAEEIKKAVSIPVISVGVLRSPDMCDAAIAAGKTDFVAIGRGLIADPEWSNKAKAGKAEEIRKCISCNQGCIGGNVHPGRRLRCAVNPCVGYEGKFDHIESAKVKKRVAVIGGGPAGLMAAISAAQRGHAVTLFEKEDKLGGQLSLASMPPDKDFIRFVTEWQAGEAKRCGVDIKLNTEATTAVLKALAPEKVIVATGSLPVIPKIEGASDAAQAWDVIRSSGCTLKGKEAVIIGGGIVGCETAHMLADAGFSVTILEMLSDVAVDLEPTTRGFLMGKLCEQNVKFITNAIVTKIDSDGVKYMLKSGKAGEIKTANPILSIGQRPFGKELADALEADGFDVSVVGDVGGGGRIIDATRTGYLAGMAL